MIMTKYKYFKKNGAVYLKLENDKICLGKGELSNSPENFVIESQLLDNYEYLFFMDSRGAKVTKNSISSIALLTKYLDEKKLSYLVISRPLNLTIFSTLLSFLENTSIKFKTVITNVGFVDATPKKLDTLNDIRSQFDALGITYMYQKLENFKLSNGVIEELGTIQINKNSIIDLANRLKKITTELYFINTPEVSKNISFKRKRPESFYHQINKSNILIKEISYRSNGRLIDVSKVGIDTFDGVHFTNNGHKIYFKEVLSVIGL